MDKIVDLLNKKITDNGIKQSYISKQTNIPVDTISKILSGKRKITAEEFLKICKVLDVRQSEISLLIKVIA